ncbi:MAG TPA: radical SAM protein [Firmicutes bacterium]|nr:radical SAM protein [Bacillota bacterium]
MIIAYPLNDALYLNITNRCTNNCRFCIRETAGGVGYNLWLKQEPTAEEIIAFIGEPTRYREIVFCGYGEPLMRPEVVVEVSRYLKNYPVRVRLNTNGLADLFLGYDILPQLEGLIDVISISLNAGDAQSYQELTGTGFGTAAFDGVLNFIRRSKQVFPKVIASVVRYPGVDIEKAASLANALGVEFRVREFSE